MKPKHKRQSMFSMVATGVLMRGGGGVQTKVNWRGPQHILEIALRGKDQSCPVLQLSHKPT